uniref:chemotaxis protein CheB n=1 Tax=Cellvibrio fontiphilus TaxID=1815559 RepID=UPI002B4BF33B|nr:chemotaxis protein CheB [Cellvibrio fontiphilus]
MLRLGLVVDNTAKQKALAQLVAQAGHKVGQCLLIGSENQLATDSELDAWLVDIAEANQDLQLLDDLFAQSRVPVILSDSSEFSAGSEQHTAWLRRTSMRLQRLRGDINLQQNTPASELWILAASTGGPAAVKRFLAELPGDLGVAFLYVQHIDAQQAVTLNRMMSNAGHYPAMVATQGLVLTANSLTLITAKDPVELLDNGTLMVNYGQHWKGSYAPAIDQIAANAARIFRARCNMIIFTGMGDDGAASCRLIKQVGGKVWVQSPDDCTSDSMPVAALATGCVSLMGTPEYLAKALVNSRHQRRAHQKNV